MAAPTLVLVGGFLGAGKTSLLLAAATRLRAAGRRVAIVTNDQGGELVDTRLFAAAGFATEEITAGCFCCRFSEFLRSAERLLAAAPHVILAEPVGSCADLSATILQPIKMFYGDRFRLAPLTVLVDPARERALEGPHVAYLFRKQLAEADLVRYTKADLYPGLPHSLSARTGQGVAEWLAEVLEGALPAGSRLLRIDYRRYAEAEAALGWLNWEAGLSLRRALTPAAVAGPLLDALDRALTAESVSIAHLKLFAQTRTGCLKAGICRNGDPPEVEGALDAAPARRHRLVLNLRAGGPPELLRALVDRAAAGLPGSLQVRHVEAFRPAPPTPEHRFQEIV
ncbi:MAG TPA: GTP-binding protein [Bryobacteraceae bacterium]|nr:GTP-binding protein [Bryobacteraceae bacterium]